MFKLKCFVQDALDKMENDVKLEYGAIDGMIHLMRERGFRVSNGRYVNGNSIALPTIVISRPDAPEWSGVWDVWSDKMEDGIFPLSEAQCMIKLCGEAISKWNEDSYLHAKQNEQKEN